MGKILTTTNKLKVERLTGTSLNHVLKAACPTLWNNFLEKMFSSIHGAIMKGTPNTQAIVIKNTKDSPLRATAAILSKE